MLEKIDNEYVGTGPAIVNGNVRQGVAIFIENDAGDLVDIDYLCSADAWHNPLADGALDWPAFDFGEVTVRCFECGRIINEGTE